jgi:beta-glucosidase
MKKVGARQGLAPVLDVSRDVRWGRTEETLGEDPYLVGVLASHYVQGLQGADRTICATLKHFVGHSFSEGARNHAPVHLGFRELNDIFMLPFEMAVKLSHAASVMPAYHDIDNEPCHSSTHLLTEILRHQWGFDGLVVADYGGIELLHSHHAIAASKSEAAALAFNAGVDIELPDDGCAATLQEAIAQGLISESRIDEIVSRILTWKFKLGLFEHPYCDPPSTPLPSQQARSLAYQVACESVVLLKNNGILPLNRNTRLAVAGATADDPLALLGGYSFPVHLILSNLDSSDKAATSDTISAKTTTSATSSATSSDTTTKTKTKTAANKITTVKEALAARFDQVSYVKGCEILTERHAGAPVFPGDIDLAMGQTQTSPISRDCSHIAETDTMIQVCDVAIVCVGDLAGLFQTGTVGEGSDTDSLDLPGVQQALLDHVLDSARDNGKPVIVIVTGGRPYHLGRAESEAAAILYGWAPGQEGANAVGDILLGRVNPSGRLTISIPKSAGAVPYYYNHKLKSSGTPVAYHFGSAYNFGFGLSYTQFTYRDFAIRQKRVSLTGQFEISLTITNSGPCAGADVVQLYVRDRYASCVRPIRELKGFGKIELVAGESRRMHFTLPVDMLNLTNHHHQRIVEGGEFEIMIGHAATDIVFQETVTVTGKVRVLPKDWRMLCQVKTESLSD